MTVKELKEKLAEMDDSDEVIVHLDETSKRGGSQFFYLTDVGERPVRPGLLPYGDDPYPTELRDFSNWAIIWVTKG